MKTVIEDILKKGLIPDIYIAESAIFVHKRIGNYAIEINSSNAEIRLFFVYIQNLALTETVLALSRVFDKPDKKFPNRCILGLIQKLNESHHKVPKIAEPYQTIEQLRIHHMPELVIKQVQDGNQAMFVKCFSDHLNFIYNQDKFQKKLVELKNMRDKVLAHNEQTEQIYKITWKNLDELIRFTQMVIGITGWAFLNTGFMHKGEYEFTQDAQSMSYNITAVLNKLNVIKDEA